MWVNKYKPTSLKDIRGNTELVLRLRDFVVNFKKKKKNGLMLYGGVGVGKTSVVYALANDLNLEIIELNASDIRNDKEINEIVGGSIEQMSLFGRSKVILIDEIDGISGKEDRGGVQALNRLIEKSSFPIILTANDPWIAKLSSLRNKVEMVEVKALDYLQIFGILRVICNKEEIKFDDTTLKSLARRNGGDLRGAIHDLETLSQGKVLKSEDLDILGDRERKENIFNALKLIFKSKSSKEVIKAFDLLDMDLDECFLWLDENLPLEYYGNDLFNAYEKLSKADIFRGRIRRWQYYRFLVYVNYLLTVGVALSKKEKKPGFVNYKRTSRVLKIWKANMINNRKKAIAEKIADYVHTSKKNVLNNFEYYRIICKTNFRICKDLKLDEEEVSWLKR